MNKSILTTLAMLATLTPRPVGASTFDAANDFSATTNSDTSVWSYRYRPGTVRDGSYLLLPGYGPANGSWIPVNPGAWTLGGGVPEIGVNQTGSDVSYSTISVWANHAMLVHPGNLDLVIVSWLSPSNAFVNISFSFADLDPNGGNGIVWFVEKNNFATTLSSGSFTNGGASGPLSLSGIPVGAGERINFIVDPSNGDYGYDSTRLTASITTFPAEGIPVILVSPASQIDHIGGSVTFSVEALGTLPLHYWWAKDGTNLADGGNISGSATSTLTLSNLLAADAGGYSAVVSNSYGSVTSAVAQLTVSQPVVSSYSVKKGIHYTQDGFDPPVAKINNGYIFVADVRFLNGTVTNAMVQPPLRTNQALLPRAGHQNELQLEHKYNSQATLDKHYPDGSYTNQIYTMDGALDTLILPVLGAAYPDPPHFTLLPTNNGYFLATWDPFVGASTNDTIGFHVEDEFGNGVWDFPDEGSLVGGDTKLLVDVTGGLLIRGHTYNATVTFTKTAFLDTNSYPGAIGEADYYAYTTVSFIAPAPPDVGSYEVSKGRRFVQTDDNLPSPEAGQQYQFQAAVQAASPNLVTSATTLLPNGTLEPLQSQGDGIHFSWSDTATTQSALDGWYGDGLYRFTINTVNNSNRSVALLLSADLYPPAPHVANFDTTQSVDANQDFNVGWDPWPDGSSSDFVQLRIEDLGNTKYFETPDQGQPGQLTGTATSATVKHGKLLPGQSWVATVVFKRMQAVDTTDYPGVLGLADHYARTKFVLKTTVPGGLSYGRSGNQMVLSWPTNSAGFTLQSTLNLTPPVLWLDVTNPPHLIGAQFTVTNAISGNAQFYRLRQL